MKTTLNILIFIFLINMDKLNSNNIYVNSIPKCGTHLLTKCISLLTGKQSIGCPTEKIKDNILPKLNSNQFLHCHLHYSKELEKYLNKNNYKTFFIYRDPRDQVVSLAFWIKKNPEWNLEDKESAVIYSGDINQLISFYITKVNLFYENYLPWLNKSKVCSIKFEDLVGEKGGGNNQAQRTAINQICKYLKIKNIKLTDYINNCAKNIFGDEGKFGINSTFRNGQIGSWRQYFSDAQKTEFKKIAGQLLIDLGYEKNFNW